MSAEELAFVVDAEGWDVAGLEEFGEDLVAWSFHSVPEAVAAVEVDTG